jgi:hypothetical protein
LANDDGGAGSETVVSEPKSVPGGVVVVWAGVGRAVNNVEFVHNRSAGRRLGVAFFEVADRRGPIDV